MHTILVLNALAVLGANLLRLYRECKNRTTSHKRR